MIIRTIGNSYSSITGLTTAQYAELRKLLSYQPDAKKAYFSGRFNSRKYLIMKNGNYPTGLNYLVDNWVNNASFEVAQYRDTRQKPTTRYFPKPVADFGDFKPYKEQIEAVDACLQNHRGIISAPTGVGKTMIAAMLVHKLSVPTLIVVTTLELKRQLTETFTKIFGNEFVGNYRDQKHIAIDNIDALTVNTVDTRYGCVILDEFHHAAAKTYRLLNKKAWTNIYYRFGLTATPFRTNDEEKLLLESILSTLIYNISYITAVNRQYIVPIEAYYIEIPKQACDLYSYPEVYAKLVVNNKQRNQILVDVSTALANNNKSTLILVREISHGNILSELTNIPFASGINEDTKSLIIQFNSSKIPALIGTVGILGEGIDTKPCEYVIIAGLGKSKVQFMQNVGRAIRKFPGKESAKVIIFKDKSHKFTINHFNAQRKILIDSYGVKAVELKYEK